MTDRGNPPQGTSLSGTVSGTPFGTCPYKGELRIPTAVEHWHCKGGSLNFAVTTTSGLSNNQSGKWTASGGTGAYAHIHGTGKMAGVLSQHSFTYSGAVSY